MDEKDTINILLIEDDGEEASLIKLNIEDKIENYYCNIKIVSSGEDAIEEFEKNPNYGIVFSDEVLEGTLTGSQTISKIKEKHPFVQAILYTGFDRAPEELEKIIKARIHYYFPKPIDWEQISQTIPMLYELKKNQEKFRLTKNERDWLQEVIESIPAQVAIIEKGSYKIIFANKETKKKHSDDIIGKPCYKVFKRYEKKCLGERCLADEAWEKGETIKTEFGKFRENINSGGEKFYIEEIVTPLKDTTGSYNLVISIGRDITKQKILSDTIATLQNIKYEEDMRLKSKYEKKIIDILLKGIEELGIDRARFYLINRKRNIVENVSSTKEFSKDHEKLVIQIDQDIEEFIDDDETFHKIYPKKELEKVKEINWGNAPNSCTLKLMAEKEIIGLIGMDNYKSGKPISKEDIEYLRNLIRYVGLSIKSMRETHNYESIKKIGSEINRNLSKEDLYQTIVENICQYFNTEMSTIFVYNELNDSLGKGATCIRKVDKTTGKIHFRTDIGYFPETYRRGEFMPGRVFEEWGTMCDNNIPENIKRNKKIIKKYENEVLDSGRIQNAIFSTLVINNKRVGLLRCGNKLDYEGNILETGFRDDEVDSFKFIGNLIADALANRQFLEKMNLISEMSRYIQEEEASNIEQTLFLILTCITMSKGLGFNRAVLFLKDEKNEDKLIVKRAVGPFDDKSAREIWEDQTWKKMEKLSVPEILDKFKDAFQKNRNISFFENPNLNKKEYYLSERFNKECKTIEYEIKHDRNIITETFKNRKSTISIEKDIFLRETGITYEHKYCYFSVPLIGSDRNIGVIYVDNKYNGKPIDPSNIELLRNFSNHVSIAIENARTYQLAQKINQIISEITKGINLNTIFGTIQEEIKKLYKIIDVCLIFIEDMEPSFLRMCDNAKKIRAQKKKDEFEYCLRCNEKTLKKAKDGKFVIKNLKTKKEILNFQPDYIGEAESRIILPITLDDEIIGLLDIYSIEENHFSEFERQLFMNLASQISIAINKIKQAEKEKEQYIIDLTHDVKTKIQQAMSISGNIELGIVKPEKIREKSIEIQNNLELLDYEISGLRFSTSVDEDRFYNLKKQSIAECVFKVLRLVGNNIVKIEKRDIENLPHILIDKRFICHLFSNLLINAKNYSVDLEKFPIEIKTYVKKNEIVFEIINYGVQIKDTKKIFNKWYREEDAKKMHVTGSGLGLNFAKRIIEKHKGQLEAESSRFKNGIYKNVFTLKFLIGNGE
jgi:GAF domain-containing protein/ActR/RegA family two-component response regulator